MTFQLDHLRFEFGELSPSDLPRIAVDALEEGLDSPSLRMLASQLGGPQEPSVTLELYRRALTELGVEALESQEVALRLIEHTLADIASGRVDPHVGGRRIAFELYPPTEPDGWTGKYAGSAIGIEALYGLADTLDDLRESVHPWQPPRSNAELERELREDLIAEARRLLRERPWRTGV